MKTNYPLLFTMFLFICGVQFLQGVDRHFQIKTYGFSVRCISLTEQETGTVTDIDDNVYQIKKIGDQWWMTENLKVSRYRNGEEIPTNLSNSEWVDANYGAFAIYPHNQIAGLNSAKEVIDAYGKIYNWYAVNDSRGLCPTGWHVPSDEEWKQLEIHLGMTRQEADEITFRGTDQAGKMKSMRTEPDPHPRWNRPNLDATNESGFSGLPGGLRHDGVFILIGAYGYWWSSTELSNHPDYVWFRRVDYIYQPNQPSSLSPGHAAAGVGISPRLTWLKSAHATTYNIQLTDNNGHNIDVDEISDTTYQVSKLEYETEYSWKVRSKNIYGYSDWSETYSFTTIAPPESKETKEAPAGVNQTVEYEESGLKFKANVQTSADVTVEVYDNQPYPGEYPEGVVQTGDMYIYISGAGIAFGNGYLHMPINLLPENVDTEIMTMLKRDASGDPWEDIGGEVVDEYLVNTVPFDALGEFTVGLTNYPTSPLSKKILNNGPTDKRINIVFLSEGYVEAELDQFTTDALDLLDYLLNISPYDLYKNYFNAFSISVASNESGSTHPSLGIYRDTYFQSTYDTYGIRRLLTLSGEGQEKVYQLLMEFVPDYDIVLVIVNDEEYGGSGGPIAVTSTNPYAPEIAIHEIGHSFAYLTDEYETDFPGWIPAEFPNATSESRREYVKWRNWFLPDTPIPTPPLATYSKVVGLFEGAQYQTTGWYRPKLTCKMRELGVPFCEVCVEYHIKSVYTLISPIDDYFPKEDHLTFEDVEDEVDIDIIIMDQSGKEIIVRWFINGNKLDIPETQFALTIGVGDLNDQSNTITAQVIDTTELVRNDEINSLLQDEVTWYVTVTSINDHFEKFITHKLYQNYPNPFNPSTVIRFIIPERDYVQLTVYNQLGQKVTQLVDEELNPGYYEMIFDAQQIPSGVYIYRLRAGEYVESKKLLLLK